MSIQQLHTIDFEYLGSGAVLDCIDSRFLPSLLDILLKGNIGNLKPFLSSKALGNYYA